MLERVVTACSYQLEVLAMSPQGYWETEVFTIRPCSSLRLYPGLSAHMWADLSPKSLGFWSCGSRGNRLRFAACNVIIIHAHTRTERKFKGLLKHES